MAANTWSIDVPNIVLTNDPDGDGGFTITVPLTLNGSTVADIDGVMTGAGALTITLKLLDGSVPLTGFQAWSTSP